MLRILTGSVLRLLLCPLVASCATTGPEAALLTDADYRPMAVPYAHGYWRNPSWDGPPVAVLRPAQPASPPAVPPLAETPPVETRAPPPDDTPPPRPIERRAAPYAQVVPHGQPVFRSGPTNGIVVVPRPHARAGEPPNRPVVSGSVTAPSGAHPPPSVKAVPQGKASPERRR